MKSRRQLLKLSLGALAGSVLHYPTTANAAPNGYGIKGLQAPELEVDYWIDAQGEVSQFKLADHAGQWVFLKCFQSWCPGCHSHGFPALKKISDAFSNNPKVVFAGVQTVFEGRFINTVDKVREIQLQYDLQMPMGHDSGVGDNQPSTMRDYRTGGTPWMILINPDQAVIYNDFGINVDEVIRFLTVVTA